MHTRYDSDLLDALPVEESRRAASQLRPELLQQDAFLCGEGHPVVHVRFPRTALVSVLGDHRDHGNDQHAAHAAGLRLGDALRGALAR